MATEVNQSKLLSLVKSGKTLPEAAKALGKPVSVVGPHFYRAEVAANPSLKVAKPTPKRIVALRDGEQLRWERIAARTNMSVNAVKEAYTEGGGDLASSWTGRGVKPNGNGTPARKRKTASRKTKTTASRKRKTAGRKTAARSRNRTRAARAAASGNPS